MTATYAVVERDVPATRDGKDLGFKVKRYYATFFGGEPKKEGVYADPFIEVWADGSLTLHKGKDTVFLYDDQWSGIVLAITKAMDDKRIERAQQRERWYLENGDRTVHGGSEVTWSINEARKILNSSPMRWSQDGKHRTEIQVDGKWLYLCRTDLKDDVATYRGDDWETGIEEVRQRYYQGIRYGARLSENEGFCVVDSFSDG